MQAGCEALYARPGGRWDGVLGWAWWQAGWGGGGLRHKAAVLSFDTRYWYSQLCVPLAPTGSRWFRVGKVSKEEYKEMLEQSRAADEALETSVGESESREEASSTPRKSAKDRIDNAW